MGRSFKRPQKPKTRNFIAKEVLDPTGPFRQRVIKLKNKYTRKPKHKGKGYDEE
jgi:hypothetical protein